MAPTLFVPPVLAAVESRLRRPDEEAGTADESQEYEGPDPTAQDAAEASRASLFQCPDCDLVFVATDEHTCSNCETDAEQVPSTLSGAP
jgi:hypothetical protein